MDSRIDKYYDDASITTQTRSSRNSKLYREVSSKYSDLDNLPLADNTDEIDMEKLKKMIADMDRKDDSKSSSIYDDLSVLESKKRNIDDNKIYDINKLLDRARNENGKLKDSDNQLLQSSKNILLKLSDSDNYDISNDFSKYDVSSDRKYNMDDNNLEMTREIKYHTKKIYGDPLIEQVMPDNDLAMDLFEDLRPIGDTIVTRPVRDESISINDASVNKVNKEFDLKNVEDTSDIDIIKKDATSDDFFTNSYEFSSSDFVENESKVGSVFKILLLILVIVIFCGVIVYFILTYGLGI